MSEAGIVPEAEAEAAATTTAGVLQLVRGPPRETDEELSKEKTLLPDSGEVEKTPQVECKSLLGIFPLWMSLMPC